MEVRSRYSAFCGIRVPWKDLNLDIQGITRSEHPWATLPHQFPAGNFLTSTGSSRWLESPHHRTCGLQRQSYHRLTLHGQSKSSAVTFLPAQRGFHECFTQSRQNGWGNRLKIYWGLAERVWILLTTDETAGLAPLRSPLKQMVDTNTRNFNFHTCKCTLISYIQFTQIFPTEQLYYAIICSGIHNKILDT